MNSSCSQTRDFDLAPLYFPFERRRNPFRTVHAYGNHPHMLRRHAELSSNVTVNSSENSELLQLGCDSLRLHSCFEPPDCQSEDNQSADNQSRKFFVPQKPKPKNVDSLIANRIRQLRESLGMNQTVFARTLETRPNRVSQWESGINKPNPDALVRIARLAEGVDKIFFLEHAGIPEGYFDGGPMISEIRDATTQLVTKTFSEVTNTFGPLVTVDEVTKVQLLKNTKRLGAPDQVQAQDIELSLSFPTSWFQKGSEVQAVRFPNLISPFISGEVIALVDVSRRDPDRLAGSVVVVRTPTGTEPVTLRKDGDTYFLVPLKEDADHQVRVLRTRGAWSIVGRVVRWIGDAPMARK